MKIKFVTLESNRVAFAKELQPFEVKGNATITFRPHQKDEKCIWVEITSRFPQVQDSFKRYLKMKEREGKLRSLKIEEVDSVTFQRQGE